jgi:phosphoribosylformylglycinamidine synthase
MKSIEAIIDYCKFMRIPVVGGKVSFYNETMNSPIKPSPVIGTIGLIRDRKHVTSNVPNLGDTLFIIGQTKDELGGSEYFDATSRFEYGRVPKVDLETDKKNGSAVLALIQKGLVNFAHDCSKGGIGVALAELAISSNLGVDINMEQIPSACVRHDHLLFSESHSRFIIGTKQADKVKRILKNRKCVFSEIGKVNETKTLNLHHSDEQIIGLTIGELNKAYDTMNKIMDGS